MSSDAPSFSVKTRPITEVDRRSLSTVGRREVRSGKAALVLGILSLSFLSLFWLYPLSPNEQVGVGVMIVAGSMLLVLAGVNLFSGRQMERLGEAALEMKSVLVLTATARCKVRRGGLSFTSWTYGDWEIRSLRDLTLPTDRPSTLEIALTLPVESSYGGGLLLSIDGSAISPPVLLRWLTEAQN